MDRTLNTRQINQAGFSLIELLVTMVVFVLTIFALTSVFVPLLTQFKQQSKIGESQIEGLVGLDMLRRDIEQAGFGLPWIIPTAVTYTEAASTTSGSLPAPDTYNDATTDAPRAIINGDGAGVGGSDYLVIKATSVALHDAAMKWTNVLGVAGGGNGTIRSWSETVEDLNAGDRVIVLIPSRGTNNQRILVNSGSSYYTQFSSPFPSAFSPSTENDVYLIYGVDPANNLRMPFNRADYYINNTTNIPQRCARGTTAADDTGVLYKSVISHANGLRGTAMPLLDCVADMQVIFRLDHDGNGEIDAEQSTLTDPDTGADLTAQQIRERLKEVRVYVLAHEGQKDLTFTYNNPTVTVGEFGAGRDFDLSASNIVDWEHYRWKVYTLIVKPNNII